MDMSCLPTLITSPATTSMPPTSSLAQLSQLSPEFEYLAPASSMLPYQSEDWTYSMSIDTYNNSVPDSQSTNDYDDQTRHSSFAEGIILQTMESRPDPNLLSAFQFSYQNQSFEASPSPSPSPACLTPGQTISSSEFVVMMNEAATRLKAMAAETSPVIRPVDLSYGVNRLQLNQYYPPLFSSRREIVDMYLSPTPPSLYAHVPHEINYGLSMGYSLPTLMACNPATLVEQHARPNNTRRPASSLSSSFSSSTLVNDSPSPSPPRPTSLPPRKTSPSNRSSYSSNYHKANNKKQKPRYLCHIPNCGRTFSRPFNLKSHGLTHEPQRPHACDQCPKTFARIHDRDRHMKGHLTEKAHCCIVCLGRFARQDAVTRHLKLSNEMNPCSLILKANGITFRDAAAGRVGRHQLGEEEDIRRTLDMLDEQARKTKASRAMELMSD
ncbi:hypothetical protein CPB97_011787 [Podila verticillata]|nr:hypothetical protein CPB97_011787 [Podila verticillata]